MEEAEAEEVVAVEEAEETVGAVEAVQGAARPPREGDGATLGGGNEEWQ